jgi:hypothetical protein
MGCYTVGGSPSTGERRGTLTGPNHSAGGGYAVTSVRLSCRVSPTLAQASGGTSTHATSLKPPAGSNTTERPPLRAVTRPLAACGPDLEEKAGSRNPTTLLAQSYGTARQNRRGSERAPGACSGAGLRGPNNSTSRPIPERCTEGEDPGTRPWDKTLSYRRGN